jgi:small subunit ribosomal protein S11
MANKKLAKAKKSEFAKIYISASFNNTLVTVADEEGNTLAWGSAGLSGFKGTRKSTPFAATAAVESTLKKAMDANGIKEAEVYIKGPGPGRDASLRAIKAAGLKVNMIADVTPMPHNGPRPKKKRKA